MITAPVEEFKATPRPANCALWIECFLHHFKDRNVRREEILEEGMKRHYSCDQLFDAMNYLKTAYEKNHIACFWQSTDTRELGVDIKRGEYWRWCDMTKEEHQRRVDDNLWFEKCDASGGTQ